MKDSGARIIVFDGRDAAGEGGLIRRLIERSACGHFVVALPAPSGRQKTQIHMQRYVERPPAAGEAVIFDRSWRDRPGVERVMGYCPDHVAQQLLQKSLHLEALLTEAGVTPLKCFLTVSEDKQDRRFVKRIEDPAQRWKLSPTSLGSYRRRRDYTSVFETSHRRQTSTQSSTSDACAIRAGVACVTLPPSLRAGGGRALADRRRAG
ncbi:hypothetical protein [Methylocella sp.]|uniref:hypothetical protein n=1 Tax=Methylocella sp. TaxID=1978226 RepID=UPI0037840C3D